MTDVFQIFSKQENFRKDDYTPEARKDFACWDKEIQSKLGYLEDGILYLPSERKDGINTRTAGTVIMQDKVASAGHVHDLVIFDAQKKKVSFDFFSMEKLEDDQFQLSLKYTQNAFFIGIPQREDHVFAILKKNRPVRFRINGKSDFTMSGRKQRTFSEYDYIIEYLGKAHAIEFKSSNKISSTKPIPAVFASEVDERKILV